MSKNVLFKTIQFSLNTQVQCQKTVPFQTIQFSISTQFSSIWSINRTLSVATAPDQNGSGSDGNEGVLRIHQSSSITGTSQSDCLVSYTGHTLGVGSYSSTEKQSVYSTALAARPIEGKRGQQGSSMMIWAGTADQTITTPFKFDEVKLNSANY